MATYPVFAITPRLTTSTVSVANTNRDGTGTLVSLITGATNGTRINEISVQATTTTVAGMIRIYLYDGSTYRVWDEVAIAAATPSASVKGIRVATTYNNLILPSASWSLHASVHNASESHNVIVMGADL